MTEQFVCPVCDAAFLLPPSIAARRRYCSKACRSDAEYAAALQRFWASIERVGECWEWTGTRDEDGYGEAHLRSRKIRAHRLAWQFVHGEPPGNHHVLHTCDNPPCIRPAHLFLGDNKANAIDRVRKGRFLDLRQGENNAGSKLFEEQVRAIRTSVETPDFLAAAFGVTKGTIYAVRARRTWWHLQ